MQLDLGSYKKIRQLHLLALPKDPSPAKARPPPSPGPLSRPPTSESTHQRSPLRTKEQTASLQLMNQRRLFLQLSKVVDSLNQNLAAKEAKNKLLRKRCENYPLEEMMDLQEARQAREQSALFANELAAKCQQLLAQDQQLIRKKHQLQLKKSQLSTELKRKRTNCESLRVRMEEVSIIQGQCKAELDELLKLCESKRSHPTFKIALQEKLLEKAKNQYELAFERQDGLVAQHEAMAKVRRTTVQPHIKYVNLIEKEVAKFYFQRVSEFEEDEGEFKEKEEQLQRLRQSCEKAQRELQGLAQGMGQLIEEMNRLSGAA